MNHTNLKESPQFVEKTINLIEGAFGYEKPNSFAVDFYPLIKKENHENCHILIENEEVIAHIGLLTKQLEVSEAIFDINMYGGIAVHEEHRGKGLFKDLFNNLLTKQSEAAFSLLWSDKTSVYSKFDFYPCLSLFEYPKSKLAHPRARKVKLKELTKKEIEELSSIISTNTIRFKRDIKDWEELTQVHSADFFLFYNNQNKLINYMVMNKGQDLKNTIHEYGHISPKELREFTTFGNLWSTEEYDVERTVLNAALLRIENNQQFTRFIKAYTAIEIGDIGESISFTFKNESFSLNREEFLQGVFGPGRFKELDIPYLNISGLDSI